MLQTILAVEDQQRVVHGFHHIQVALVVRGDAERGLLQPVLVRPVERWAAVAGRADRATYVLLAIGSWLYVSGHGIHLAANSIWNTEPSRTAELWDEYVGQVGAELAHSTPYFREALNEILAGGRQVF